MNNLSRTIRTLSVISWETFVLLRRDKVFVPALVASLLISAFANLASDWSVEDFTKILFDIGFFGFQITGSLVAIFWGAKIISDSRQEGSLEVQLSAPISRGTWIIGKYIGLSICLITVGVILFAIWQGLMLLNQFGWMTQNQIVCYLFMVLSWLVQGALAIMLASFMGQAIAMFSTLCLWLTGMASSLVANTVSPDSSLLTKTITSGIARFWDFQQFNLVNFIQDNNWLGSQELAYRAAYGVLLILVQISLSVTIFSSRDVNA
jgi:Cu-processing system permease protein